jgi:hypothetical protein
MTTGILTQIYFLINIFCAGFYLADNYKWANSSAERITTILWTLGTSLFGVIYIVGSIIIASAQMIHEWINTQTQITFWLSFYLTKKWDKVEKDVLERINRSAYKKKDSQKRKDKIYCLSVKKLNARNNYTYVHEDAVF